MTPTLSTLSDPRLMHLPVLLDQAAMRNVLQRELFSQLGKRPASTGDLSTDTRRDTRHASRPKERHESLQIVECRVAWTKYRPADHLRVAYAIQLEDKVTGTRQSLWLHGRAYATTDAERYAAAARSRPWAMSGGVPGLSFIESLGLTLWAFPNDAKLALGEVTCGDTIAARLQQSLLARCGVPRQCVIVDDVSTVSYVPEQALIQRIVCQPNAILADACGATTFYLKTVNAHADIDRMRAGMRQAAGTVTDGTTTDEDATDGSLATRNSSFMDYWPESRTWVLSATEGEPLAKSRTDSASWRNAMTLAGRAVAQFHQPAAGDVATREPRPWRAAVDRNRRLLEVCACDLLPRFDALCRRLTRDAKYERDDPEVLLHGDLHAHNVLVAHSQAALIDLEDVHQGPRCHDLGTFIASQLTRDALDKVADCDNIASLDSMDRCDDGENRGASGRECGVLGLGIRAFLNSYAACSTNCIDSGSLRWHILRSLLAERVYRSVTHVRPTLLRDLHAILSLAERLVADALVADSLVSDSHVAESLVADSLVCDSQVAESLVRELAAPAPCPLDSVQPRLTSVRR